MTRQVEGVHYRTVYAVTKGDYYDGLNACQFIVPTEADAKRAVEAGLGNDYQELPLMADGVLPEKVTVYSARKDAKANVIRMSVDAWFPWGITVEAEYLSGWPYFGVVRGVDRAEVEAMARQVFGDLPIKDGEGDQP